jgi:hypothetical protein
VGAEFYLETGGKYLLDDLDVDERSIIRTDLQRWDCGEVWSGCIWGWLL